MNHPQILSRLRHKVTHGSRGSRASRVSGSTRHTVHDCSAFGPRAATSRSYSPSNRLAHICNLSPRCYMAVDHCICLYKSHASTAQKLSNTGVVKYNTGVFTRTQADPMDLRTHAICDPWSDPMHLLHGTHAICVGYTISHCRWCDLHSNKIEFAISPRVGAR